MHAKLLAGPVIVLAMLPALASEPGQPLDCSDWVFGAPGLSCSYFETPSSSQPAGVDGFFYQEGAFQEVDNDGKLLMLRRIRLGDCCSGCAPLYRLELARFDGTNVEVVAHVEDRCNGNNLDILSPRGRLGLGSAQFSGSFAFNFDEENGRVLIALASSHCPGSNCSGDTPYSPQFWIASIEGLTTTFEILQTYTPTSGPISFRVPYMPEGLPAADYFDTYYGELTSPIDFTQAQPLQCGYPATAPSVGDYLTVADTLPIPAPGHGRYYVTAVTHQGQRRYGRQTIGGVLGGRNPAVLPVCAEVQ